MSGEEESSTSAEGSTSVQDTAPERGLEEAPGHSCSRWGALFDGSGSAEGALTEYAALAGGAPAAAAGSTWCHREGLFT